MLGASEKRKVEHLSHGLDKSQFADGAHLGLLEQQVKGQPVVLRRVLVLVHGQTFFLVGYIILVVGWLTVYAIPGIGSRNWILLTPALI